METSPIDERSSKPQLGPRASVLGMKKVRNLSKARANILDLLEGGPRTVASLARFTGQHENTIREHLEALVDENLAVKFQVAQHLPGRPAWLYRLSDQSSIGEYAGLASALAGAIVLGSADPVYHAIEAGKTWAPEIIRNLKPDLIQQQSGANKQNAIGIRRKVALLLDLLGFAPKHNTDLTRTKLMQCPLLDAARVHPNVICSVHLGIIRGALTAFGADTKSIEKVELQPFSAPGACLLKM